MTKPKNSAKKPSKSSASSRNKKGSQNGKGDSPRNLSPRFRENYDAINWKKTS